MTFYERDWISGAHVPVTALDHAARALAIVAVVCVAFWVFFT